MKPEGVMRVDTRKLHTLEFNMHTTLVSCLALVAIASAMPQQPVANSLVSSTTPIAILRYENEGVNHDGSYKWAYETQNEIVAEEKGYVKNFGQGEPNEIQTVEGSYSYTAPDGTRITVTYTADDEGFKPRGDHLPTPPPIPEPIQRALDFLATLAPSKQQDEATNVVTTTVKSA